MWDHLKVTRKSPERVTFALANAAAFASNLYRSSPLTEHMRPQNAVTKQHVPLSFSSVPRRTKIFASFGVLAGLALLSLGGCKGHSLSASSLTRYFHHRKSASKANSTDFASDLQGLAGNPQLSTLKSPDYTNYQPQVGRFYENRNWEVAWTRDGRPTEQATRLIQLFGDAANKGLDPEDYDGSRWAQRTQQLKGAPQGKAIAEFDVAMTVSAMRFLSDLHLGRINPQSLDYDIDVPARRAQFDLATLLNEQLIDADDVASVVNGVEPQNPMYKKTEDALPHYLQLAKQSSQPLPPAAKPIGPNGTYPGMQALAQRLALEGDMPGQAQAPAAGDRYTPEIAQAVQQFQNRHGLNADGKLSQATIDALNVPMNVRAQQISDSLERWRWLPDNFVKPRVLVNLPEYYVRAYDTGGNLAFKMKVVDGESKDNHNTPVFVRTMRYMIFRPFWNLPPDIVKKDLLARHASQSYFDAHGYEVTDRNGKPVTGWSMDDLEHSRYLVRQKPGPKNSLGLVKFMFPNEYDIYMHSTPEMNLFNLAQRDRSHGCVRLNDAEKMANFVLDGQGDWNAEKIHQAMYGEPLSGGGNGGDTPANGPDNKAATKPTSQDLDSGQSSTDSDVKDNHQVNLQTQLPVVLTYLTANADEDGTMHFFDDVYGYDKELEDALAKPRPYDQSPKKINPKEVPGGTE